jgi:hypothetical protein
MTGTPHGHEMRMEAYIGTTEGMIEAWRRQVLCYHDDITA